MLEKEKYKSADDEHADLGIELTGSEPFIFDSCVHVMLPQEEQDSDADEAAASVKKDQKVHTQKSSKTQQKKAYRSGKQTAEEGQTETVQELPEQEDPSLRASFEAKEKEREGFVQDAFGRPMPMNGTPMGYPPIPQMPFAGPKGRYPFENPASSAARLPYIPRGSILDSSVAGKDSIPAITVPLPGNDSNGSAKGRPYYQNPDAKTVPLPGASSMSRNLPYQHSTHYGANPASSYGVHIQQGVSQGVSQGTKTPIQQNTKGNIVGGNPRAQAAGSLAADAYMRAQGVPTYSNSAERQQGGALSSSSQDSPFRQEFSTSPHISSAISQRSISSYSSPVEKTTMNPAASGPIPLRAVVSGTQASHDLIYPDLRKGAQLTTSKPFEGTAPSVHPFSVPGASVVPKPFNKQQQSNSYIQAQGSPRNVSSGSLSDPLKSVAPQPLVLDVKNLERKTAQTKSVPAIAVETKKESESELYGKPILDDKVIEESTIFDEPPVPIAEGMKDADTNHARKRHILIAALVAGFLIAVGVVVYVAYSNQFTFDELLERPAITSETQQLTSQSSSSSWSTSSSSANAAVGDQSGSVVYQYTALTSDGTAYDVEETVMFNADGECESAVMEMEFPNEQAAKSYTDSLAKDYGSLFMLESLDGANATVNIDNSGLHLDREKYENALRYSVEDLVILKK